MGIQNHLGWKDDDMDQQAMNSNRFDRQSFLGSRSQSILNSCQVGMAGLGGGGSHVVQQLAHIGIGHFLLFDPDVVEDRNLNRFVGACESDVALATPKLEVAKRLIAGV